MMTLYNCRHTGILLAFLLAFFAATVHLGVSKAATQEVSLSAKELFFYDEEGRKQPLVFLPKLAVKYENFSDDLSGVDMASTMSAESVIERFRKRSSLTPLGVTKTDGSRVSTYTVSFLPNTTFEELVEAITAVREPGVVEVTPIFRLERREAAIDGIVIDTKIEMSPNRIKTFLQRALGPIPIRYVNVEENKAIVKFDGFFFTNTKIPLDILTLTNLLNKNDDAKLWLTRARPNFVFLDQPVSVFLSVSPLSGTVGEERTLILTVYVRGKNVAVNEDVLPVFGEGSFVPVAMGSPPDGSFFKIKKVEKRRWSDEFGDVIEHAWKFSLFAAEPEWGIVPVPVLFKQGDKNEEIQTPPYTFVTLLHTKQSIEIKDMPASKRLPSAETFLSRITGKGGEVVSADLPRYWFDRFLNQGESVTAMYVAIVGGGILTFSVLTFFVGILMSTRLRSSRHTEARRAIFLTLSAMKESYTESLRSVDITAHLGKETLAEMEENINSAFRIVFPALPGKRFSLKLVTEHAGSDTELKAFIESNAKLLEDVCRTTEKRYAPTCSLEKDEYETLMNRVVQLLEKLIQQYQKGEV